MTELTHAPNLTALYAKAIASAPMRRGGELPGTEYVRQEIEIDRAHLAAYNRACGFGVRDELPVTYPHVLSFGTAVRLMTDPDFPFPLVGLVHIANTITQHSPLTITETFAQRVWLENLAPHPKGQRFDVVTETSVREEVVWREVSTYLRRGKSDESARREDPAAESDTGAPTAAWRLPADLGRRYAAISGDRNPIHLHPWLAKAFGFPRTIAYGMWSQARCLAAFEGRIPDACTVRVEFRKPVLLPSTVDFAEREHAGGWHFALRSRSGKPHLLGSLTT
jgi:acyl dehydratase